MKIKRRQFLKQSAIGVGGVLMASRLQTPAASNPPHFDPYELVTLGRSGLKVSRFSLGTGVRASRRESNHTRMGKENFEALIRGAYERGIRSFDLADLYGTHPYIVPALKGVARDSYAMITKIWFRPGGIPETERPDADVLVERFLKEMQTDHIDLLLLHCCTAAGWNQDLRRQMDLMAGFKQKGMVRAVGVSCHSLEALETAVNEPWVDSVHARINPFQLQMDGPPEQVMSVLKKLHAAGKGVVGMKIIGEGRLRNDSEKIDESVRYALQSGCVDVLNVGCESLAEVDDFAARVRKVPRV